MITYGHEKYIREAIDGVFMQETNFEIELIIADDGSRESTKALIESYAKNYPVPVRHLWHEDEGYRRQEILS